MAGRGGSEQPGRVEPATGFLPILADDSGHHIGRGRCRHRDRPDRSAQSAHCAAEHCLLERCASEVCEGEGCDGGRCGADPPGDPDTLAAQTPALLEELSAGEIRLTSRPESAAVARWLAVSLVRRWGLARLCDTVELLVSELVGNAVRHTGARTFGLRVQHRRGWVRVEVRDPSRALPCLMPVREMDISGRGLFLVDKLSDRWGVDLLPRGKTTWFELRAVDR